MKFCSVLFHFHQSGIEVFLHPSFFSVEKIPRWSEESEKEPIVLQQTAIHCKLKRAKSPLLLLAVIFFCFVNKLGVASAESLK